VPRNTRVLFGPSPIAIILLIITGLKKRSVWEVAHQIVGVKRRLVTARTLALAEEDLLAEHFGLARFARIAVNGEGVTRRDLRLE
jgi:hypothetical protein